MRRYRRARQTTRAPAEGTSMMRRYPARPPNHPRPAEGTSVNRAPLPGAPAKPPEPRRMAQV
jgi:hypothetical protein